MGQPAAMAYPTPPSTTASADNTKVATAKGHPGLRRTSWIIVTTSPMTPIAKAAQQRYPDRSCGTFCAAGLRRAVIQERERKQPHDSRGPTETTVTTRAAMETQRSAVEIGGFWGGGGG
jgi:hypothetical protein